jgi:hypothetical protein
LLDNFKKFPVPKEPKIPRAKKNFNLLLKWTWEHSRIKPAQFLPYLNLYIAARLMLYEAFILSLQSFPLIQLMPLLMIEIFVTIAIMEGHFNYGCFENWGFFRYMCQQLTISFILFMGVLGTPSLNVKTYGETIEDKGKVVSTSPIVRGGNFFEVIVVLGVLITVLVEVFEIFRKWFEDLHEAWERGGKQGRKGIMRIFGSNEGDTMLLENLLGY